MVTIFIHNFKLCVSVNVAYHTSQLQLSAALKNIASNKYFLYCTHTHMQTYISTHFCLTQMFFFRNFYLFICIVVAFFVFTAFIRLWLLKKLSKYLLTIKILKMHSGMRHIQRYACEKCWKKWVSMKTSYLKAALKAFAVQVIR